MSIEALSTDTIHEDGEKEVEALAAGKQNQDFPQDLLVDDNKFSPQPKEEATDGGMLCEAANEASPDEECPELKPDRSDKFLFQAGNPPPPSAPADDMADLIKRYSVLPDQAVDAIVLWTIAGYLINSFRIFPKLSLISPEKRCGKTTTMEVIQSIANAGVLASNITAASIYRITEQLQPTLLIDEADTFLKDGDAQLVGLVNSSHTKSGATVIRCDGDNYQAKPFSTWMPMVFASIGDLPPTIMDRSIVVNLRRKKACEITDIVPVDLADLHKPLREKILHWCTSNEPDIRSDLIRPPNKGNDRAADNWVPLFSVAHQIGGAWPARCEQAYQDLTTVAELELPTQLLLDVQSFFHTHEDTRVSSASLLDELCKDSTGPWQACNNGKKLSPNQMANLLSPYGIKPKTLRFGDQTKRGYEQGQFVDAFERYLP